MIRKLAALAVVGGIAAAGARFWMTRRHGDDETDTYQFAEDPDPAQVHNMVGFGAAADQGLESVNPEPA